MVPTLNDCERKYSQTEKEALSLVWAVEHINIFLWLNKVFDLVTDHKSVEFVFVPKSRSCARVERWVLSLQAYRYNIQNKSRKTNIEYSLPRLCESVPNQPLVKDYVHQIVEVMQNLRQFL